MKEVADVVRSSLFCVECVLYDTECKAEECNKIFDRAEWEVQNEPDAKLN